MKYPHEYAGEPLRPEDFTYTYEAGPRPDRLKAIAKMYDFTFIDTEEGIFCWAKRSDGKLIGRTIGATKDEARTAARALVGSDFDKLPPEEQPDIDTRKLRLA